MRHLDQLIREVGLYRRAFGNLRGVPIGLLAGSSWLRGREAKVRAPGLPLPFVLRIGTSDVEVYYQVFVAGEYDLPLEGEPSVVVDGGANIGLTSLWFAARFPNARILAVEPDAANFLLLTRNTRSYARIERLQAALWRAGGEVILEDPGAGAASLRVRAATSGNDRGPAVQAVTLRELFDRFGLETVDLLKLDVEGAELTIFTDADAWIEDVRAIAIELHDRFQAGASAAFYRATEEFRSERSNGEIAFVQRA